MSFDGFSYFQLNLSTLFMFGKIFLIFFILGSGVHLYAQHRISENAKPKGPLKPFTIYMIGVTDTGAIHSPIYFYDVG